MESIDNIDWLSVLILNKTKVTCIHWIFLNISILVSEFFIIWHMRMSKENMSSERNNFVFGRLTSKAKSYLSKLEIEVQNKRWFANKLQSYKIFKESCMARRRARNFAETKVMKEINIFCCHQPRGEKIKRIKEHCMSCAKNYLLKV